LFFWKSPLFSWCIFGAAIGIALGGLISSNKYNLGNLVKFAACLPAILVITIILIGAGPFSKINPRPQDIQTKSDIENRTDSTSSVVNTTTYLKPEQSLEAVAPAQSKSQKVRDNPRPSCEVDVAGITVTIRSDSVKLFYRTSKVKDGDWSDWESISIPQPGQYTLSGPEGKVFANSIQYYYEAKQEAVRSASDPYRKSLCNGSLFIDTY
jgi:hypothetical protein